MKTLPTAIDLWLAGKLAGFQSGHPQLTLLVQGAIDHSILGGLWFGAALFILWIQAAKGNRREIRARMFTILVGSILAILLGLIARALISWPPPARYPNLSIFFPGYLRAYTGNNSFPSLSTALYGSLAMGIYSLHKPTGRLLWILVAVCVALPRMYVGGHYMTDVLAGLLLGLFGYTISRYFLEVRLISKSESLLESRPYLQFLADLLVFIWVVEVIVEFRDVPWLIGTSRLITT
jgi:membrane-associated phospholipid phosphatase